MGMHYTGIEEMRDMNVSIFTLPNNKKTPISISFWSVFLKLSDKMCIPEDLLGLCNEMATQETKSAAKIICIPARDR